MTSLEITPTSLPDVKLVVPTRLRDERGYFSELYRRSVFESAGIFADFVQENHSLSLLPGTVRGLHFQSEPFAQGKLVRVARGRIFDVAIDIRRSSPTFGRYVSVELSAADGHQLWIPPGFAHGFCTLEANCEVIYKVTNYYSKENEYGLSWNDPEIGINWPIDENLAILSEKDKSYPTLARLPVFFS